MVKNSDFNHELENDRIRRDLYKEQITNIVGRDIKRPYYSKRGFLIEHPNFTKEYFVHLLLRTLAFAFDFLIPGMIQYFMYMALQGTFGTEVKWVFSGITSMIYFHVYFSLTMAILKGRTIGLAIAKLTVVHKSGFSTSFVNYYFRGLISSVFAVPWIGWMLAGLNALSTVFIFRGVSLVDIISGTVLVTNKRKEELLIIERMQE